jgi:AmiR/NasT family two-component response regulator
MFMNKIPKMALIVGQPGPLRNSLFSLMTTLPQIDLVAESKDMASLMRLGAQIQPDLVLMQPESPEAHLVEAIHFIKSEWPASRTIVLVDDISQQQEAESAGVDVVLFKGYRAAGLMNVVEELLLPPPTAGGETASARAVHPI